MVNAMNVLKHVSSQTLISDLYTVLYTRFGDITKPDQSENHLKKSLNNWITIGFRQTGWPWYEVVRTLPFNISYRELKNLRGGKLYS